MAMLNIGSKLGLDMVYLFWYNIDRNKQGERNDQHNPDRPRRNPQ